MQLIVKTIFGSHLYGTDTPESDKDFKGIFMPSKKEIFLGKIPKSISESTKKGSESKNTAEDVDTEIYSLQYFIELALKGETIALDMLHTPKELTLISSPIWEDILLHRKKFYTKSLKSFVGYARKQAAKYGIKGSRISAAKSVIELLKKYHPDTKMYDLWHKLPVDEHLYFTDSKQNIRMYQVCGKQIQETAKVGYVLPILESFVEQYGARARLAEKNEGIDWKAVSHALRAAMQTESILTKGTIEFPLPKADYLRKVKQGELHYINDVAPVLEYLMDRAEYLSKTSTLPKVPDREFWESFVVKKVEEFYGFTRIWT